MAANLVHRAGITLKRLVGEKEKRDEDAPEPTGAKFRG